MGHLNSLYRTYEEDEKYEHKIVNIFRNMEFFYISKYLVNNNSRTEFQVFIY